MKKWKHKYCTQNPETLQILQQKRKKIEAKTQRTSRKLAASQKAKENTCMKNMQNKEKAAEQVEVLHAALQSDELFFFNSAEAQILQLSMKTHWHIAERKNKSEE